MKVQMKGVVGSVSRAEIISVYFLIFLCSKQNVNQTWANTEPFQQTGLVCEYDGERADRKRIVKFRIEVLSPFSAFVPLIMNIYLQ
jgi:hypothetical protein